MLRARAFLVVIALLAGLSAGFTHAAYAAPAAPTGDSAISDPFQANCNDSDTKATTFCKNAKEETKNRYLVYGDKSLLVQIAQFIVFLTGAISVIMIIIGGFRYVVSGGDSASVKSAKDTILYAVVGLIIAVSCQFIVSFVLSSFL